MNCTYFFSIVFISFICNVCMYFNSLFLLFIYFLSFYKITYALILTYALIFFSLFSFLLSHPFFPPSFFPPPSFSLLLFFFHVKCCMCHLALGDGVATRSKLEEFKNVDYSFASSREGAFLEQLLNVRTYALFILFTMKIFQLFVLRYSLKIIFFVISKKKLIIFLFPFCISVNTDFRLLTVLTVKIFLRPVLITIESLLSILGKRPYY